MVLSVAIFVFSGRGRTEFITLGRVRGFLDVVGFGCTLENFGVNGGVCGYHTTVEGGRDQGGRRRC